jgi:hypothetical protein
MEKGKLMTLLGLELQPLGHLARIQALYRLLYRGCSKVKL